MLDAIKSAFTNPLTLILTIAIFLFACATTFDKRLTQFGAKGGWHWLKLVEPNKLLPWWVGVFIWLEYICLIVLLILNWLWAIILYIILFILAVLPVLEIIGSVLMRPLLKKTKED